MKSKFPLTVVKANRLYVRKTISIGGKQKQIWRVCEPPTKQRAKEILTEIEAEILSDGDENSIELAKIFLSTKSGEMKFSDFKNKVKIIGETSKNLDY